MELDISPEWDAALDNWPYFDGQGFALIPLHELTYHPLVSVLAGIMVDHGIYDEGETCSYRWTIRRVDHLINLKVWRKG